MVQFKMRDDWGERLWFLSDGRLQVNEGSHLLPNQYSLVTLEILLKSHLDIETDGDMQRGSKRHLVTITILWPSGVFGLTSRTDTGGPTVDNL